MVSGHGHAIDLVIPDLPLPDAQASSKNIFLGRRRLCLSIIDAPTVRCDFYPSVYRDDVILQGTTGRGQRIPLRLHESLHQSRALHNRPSTRLSVGQKTFLRYQTT